MQRNNVLFYGVNRTARLSSQEKEGELPLHLNKLSGKGGGRDPCGGKRPIQICVKHPPMGEGPLYWGGGGGATLKAMDLMSTRSRLYNVACCPYAGKLRGEGTDEDPLVRSTHFYEK